MRTTLFALGAGLMMAAAVPVVAHHGFGGEFDPNRPVLLKGPITKIEWVNPHTWIHVEVTKPDGVKEVWMVEGGTPNTLLRRGITKESLKIGTAIVVDGYLDLAGFRAHVVGHLPEYARPLFLRIKGEIEVTGTFKQKKVDLVKQGFDPTGTTDPIYFNDSASQSFVRLDKDLYDRIQAGKVRV